MPTNEQLLTISETFSILGDLSRLRIILCCLEKETFVSDIANELELSQSLVSHHLRLLRAVGLISRRKEGKHVFYTIADNHVSTILQQMLDHTSECEPSFE
jgi:DNA-binding transcriptional ArsR family regulator